MQLYVLHSGTSEALGVRDAARVEGFLFRDLNVHVRSNFFSPN